MGLEECTPLCPAIRLDIRLDIPPNCRPYCQKRRSSIVGRMKRDLGLPLSSYVESTENSTTETGAHSIHVRAASIAGNQHPLNEDCYGTFGHYAWVIDGASRPLGEPQNVAEYVRVLDQSLYRAVSASSNAPLQTLVAKAIWEVSRSDIDGASATLSLARIHPTSMHYIVLGDAGLLHTTKDGHVQKIQDNRLSTCAAEERTRYQRLLATSAPESKIRHAHEQLVKKENSFRNVPGGFWVAANEPDAAKHALTGKIEHNMQPVVLGSDGFLNCKPPKPLYRGAIHAANDEAHLEAMVRDTRPQQGKIDDATVAVVFPTTP